MRRFLFQLISLACFIFIITPFACAEIVAVFFALDADLRELKREASAAQSIATSHGRTITKLTIDGHQIIAAQMGSGNVESAMTAEGVFARFRCDAAISIGPAGALSRDLDPGAWYLVSRVIYWPKGSETSGGFIPNQRAAVDIPQGDRLTGTESVDTLALASGESFIISTSTSERLQKRTNASLVDMNGYGVALACENYDIPLRLMRIVSDGADESAGETFEAFVDDYSGSGAKIVLDFVRNLANSPESPNSYENIRRLREKPPVGAEIDIP